MGHGPHSSKLFCRSVNCVCKCVLYYCHRVATQFQLTNISYQNMTPVYRFVIQGRFIHWPGPTSGDPDSVVYIVQHNWLNIYHMHEMIFLPKPVMECLN